VADRVDATGILLVGGASERFGSPKALASFRGETLAERAWRVLQETCDEVIAVGKDADALELPFPVLDDDGDGRAPVFGVIAGLRAAGHERAIVLPVDCPLMTPELLRELLDAGAVPQTGPLPGVYTRAMLHALEERVAVGEFSLRGVNPTVVEVDESRLLDVDTQTDLVVAASIAFDDAVDERPVLTPDDAALHELAADFWATALWAGRRLRKGDVFVAVDTVNAEAVARRAPRLACEGSGSGRRCSRTTPPERWADGRAVARARVRALRPPRRGAHSGRR
jgi:molybdopterin-guanine dinucleotide biosynthesis protein A